jgi:hypothetical protein
MTADDHFSAGREQTNTQTMLCKFCATFEYDQLFILPAAISIMKVGLICVLL